MEADSVVMAIGQTPEQYARIGCEVDSRARILVDKATMQTSSPEVFAAGDVVTGPSSVIEAVAAGRRAAVAIDRFLGGQGDIEQTFAPVEEPGIEPLEEQEERPRVAIPKRPAADRAADFDEVELGYTEQEALAEAGRCLRCDLEENED